MSQSFSTNVVPISERVDAWELNARQICGDSRFQFPKRQLFHGSIERRNIGGLEFTLFSSSSVSFSKFPAGSAHPGEAPCIIVTQLEGIRSYLQDGAVAILRPGDSTLIDSGRPWSSECGVDCSRLYLRVPKWLLENRLRVKSLPTVRCISGASGLGATLAHFLTSLYEQAGVLDENEGAAAVEAYLELLAACIGHSESFAPDSKGKDLVPRVDAFIETHLADPSLTPAKIASTVGISVRHLHRLFNAKGHTVSGRIRERRLEQCGADLSDARLRIKTITEIAFLWGFSDSAHFSRLFKNRFGICPYSFRSRKLEAHHCNQSRSLYQSPAKGRN